IQETGFNLGGRTAGHSERVVVGIGRRKAVLAEKKFPNRRFILKPKNVFILNELRKLGLSAVPTARLAIEGKNWSGARQIMTDLTRGGKFRVADYRCLEGTDLQVANLKNIRRIEAQIQSETGLAKKHGFLFEGREWLIVIDPKENIGKPYIVDVKNARLSDELNGKYVSWTKKIRSEE
ncbi:MAG: hypothetical protein WC602_06875, partial [archaeon]